MHIHALALVVYDVISFTLLSYYQFLEIQNQPYEHHRMSSIIHLDGLAMPAPTIVANRAAGHSMKWKEDSVFDIATIVSTSAGVLGVVAGLGSYVNQRRQTQIMQAGLEKEIAKEFEEPESDSGVQMESKLKGVISRRLNDMRKKIKDDFNPRLDQIERQLQQDYITEYSRILANLSQLLHDEQDILGIANEVRAIRAEIIQAQERIMAETGRYTSDIATHGREIGMLQQQLDDVRHGIGDPDTLRAQIRAMAQQLLQMTSQG